MKLIVKKNRKPRPDVDFFYVSLSNYTTMLQSGKSQKKKKETLQVLYYVGAA